MFVLRYCRSLQSTSPFARTIVDSTSGFFYLVEDALLTSNRSFSSLITGFEHGQREDLERRRSFVASYLINSCGLTPDAAKCISEKGRINFASPQKPDTVLNFLRIHGFTPTEIAKIVRILPQTLLANVQENLVPKFVFLHSTGFSGDDIRRLISGNPLVLCASLKNKIIRVYDFLKSVLSQDEKVRQFLVNSPEAINLNVEKDIVPKFMVLREAGVSEPVAMHLLRWQTRIFASSTERFHEHFKKVIDMGFDPTKKTFISAFQVMRTRKSTLDLKLEFLRGRGWAKDEVWSAFKRNPQLLKMSLEVLGGKLDFLVHEMGYELADIARYPAILNYSLENFIVRRCSVVRILQLKGLIKDQNPPCSALVFKNQLMKYYVMKYQDQVPGLMDILEGRTRLQDLGFSFKGRHLGTKT